MIKWILACCLFLLCRDLRSQTPVQDTIYMMNGQTIGEKVVDTLLGTVTIRDPKKPEKNISFEHNQLYMVRYAGGQKRYYYSQDFTINNVFTREEMWLYMKGENDARRGFKARGALIGGAIAGLIGGATGTLWGPIAPYGFMALTGITKVRIHHNTVSNPRFLESDAYILGYERVARQKRKLKSLISGTAGLLVGYGVYALFHQYYPN